MLRISDLHFTIGRTPILNGVSFDVREGEKLGIIGPNGSGKTTLGRWTFEIETAENS